MTAPQLTVSVQGQGSVGADLLNTYEQTCDNVAQLRSFVGTLGVQVFARGITSPNDGGAGPFYWDVSGTGPDDGVNVIVPPGSALGCWVRLSVVAQSAEAAFGFKTTAILLSAFPAPIVLSDGTVAITDGRTTEGDGGGAVFYYNASDTTTADNGGTIRVDGVGRRWYINYSGPVSVAWFGAFTAASASTNATAINAASALGKALSFPAVGVYQFNATLRFKADGQEWRGQGGGHVNVPSVATTLQYTGAGGSPAVSFYDGTVVRQACTLIDININGNSLANKVLEGYVDSYGSGAWYNRVVRSVLYGGTSHCCYLGDGSAPAFANDYYFDGVVFYNSPIGIEGAGSTYSFSNNCTVYGCSTYGINALTGSDWSIGNTIFSHNGWDINMANGAAVAGTDGWMEDSTNGCVQAVTALHLSLKGYRNLSCNVSATALMSLGNAAGEIEITGCKGVSVSSSSITISGIGSTTQRSFLGSFLTIPDGVSVYSSYGLIGAGVSAINSANGSVNSIVRNINVGVAADAAFLADNGNQTVNFGMRGLNESTYGVIPANSAYFYTNAPSGATIMSETGDLQALGGSKTAGVRLTGGGTSWVSISDIRKKTDMVLIGGALEKVLRLHGYIGRYKTDEPSKRRVFMSAQEVQAVLPQAVVEDADGYLSMSLQEIVPLLVEAVHTLNERLIAR